jgi:hypothetical protein
MEFRGKYVWFLGYSVTQFHVHKLCSVGNDCDKTVNIDVRNLDGDVAYLEVVS